MNCNFNNWEDLMELMECHVYIYIYIYIYAIIKTMSHPGYHHNGFVATMHLGT